jgi:S-adenosylmethionine hydrolase
MDELKLIFPNSKYTRINQVSANMKYITTRKYKNNHFVFLDECIHFGNVITFIRKKGFLINEMNIQDQLKEEISISVDKSYFNNVELYQINE